MVKHLSTRPTPHRHKKYRSQDTDRDGESGDETDEDALAVVGDDAVRLDGEQRAHEDEHHHVDERLDVVLELHATRPPRRPVITRPLHKQIRVKPQLGGLHIFIFIVAFHIFITWKF